MGKRAKESFGALGCLEEKGGGLLDGDPVTAQHSAKDAKSKCQRVRESAAETRRKGRISADGSEAAAAHSTQSSSGSEVLTEWKALSGQGWARRLGSF